MSGAWRRRAGPSSAARAAQGWGWATGRRSPGERIERVRQLREQMLPTAKIKGEDRVISEVTFMRSGEKLIDVGGALGSRA